MNDKDIDYGNNDSRNGDQASDRNPEQNRYSPNNGDEEEEWEERKYWEQYFDIEDKHYWHKQRKKLKKKGKFKRGGFEE